MTNKKKPKTEEYVTTSQFKGLENAVLKLVDMMGEKQNAEEVETPEEKLAIKLAKPSDMPAPKEWEDVAKLVIGEDFVDHCEMHMPPEGGTIFTVVIKTDKSNMPQSYLDIMKTDRRSKAINNGGIEAVRSYCKLVRQNIKKSQLT